LFINQREYAILDLDENEKLLGYFPYDLDEKLMLRLAEKIHQDEQGEIYTMLVGKGDFSGFRELDGWPQKLEFGGKLSVSQPLIDLNNRILEPGREEAFNCEVKKSGTVDRKWDDGGIRYFASDGGVSCDYFGFADVWGFDDYLLWVSAENMEGRGIKVYATNPDASLINHEFIADGGTAIRILPTYAGAGYTINLESRSFGPVNSNNVLSGIGLIPINLKWLNDIRANQDRLNEVPLISVNSSAVESQVGLYSTNEAYEAGWLGWYEGKWLPHVVVDGWANGYLLEPGMEASKVKIIFWPQCLQWGGMALALGTLVWLGIRAKKGS
jgi:hypothetical protein